MIAYVTKQTLFVLSQMPNLIGVKINLLKICSMKENEGSDQGFPYLLKLGPGISLPSEVGTRGLLKRGKKHLDHQNGEKLILVRHFK